MTGPETPITVDQILQVVGEQCLEIRLLRAQLLTLQQEKRAEQESKDPEPAD